MADDETKTVPEENNGPADAPVEQATDDTRPDEQQADEVSELLQKLDEVTAEAKTHRDDYLRAVADLENYRKRALREKDEVRLRAEGAVLEDCLPVLDNFRLGLEAARRHEAGKAFVEGFAMVFSQLENVLRQHGVEELAPQGEAFDPNLHESVAHQPHDDVPEGHVSEVQRVGYRHRERLLRAAVVVVSSGPAAASNEAASGGSDKDNSES